LVHKEGNVGWGTELEKRTNGKVKMEYYPAEALGKMAEMYDLVVSGVADLSLHFTGATPGRFPVTDVCQIPFVTKPGTNIEMVAWQMYQKYPEIQKEYSDTKLLALVSSPTHSILTKKPVRKLRT